MKFRDNTQENAFTMMTSDHQGKPLLAQLGTGFGKTYIANAYGSVQNEPTVIAMPTHALITQAHQKMLSYGLVPPEQIKRFYPMSAYPSASKCAQMDVNYDDSEYVDDIITRLHDSRPNLHPHEIALDTDCPKEDRERYEAERESLEGAKILLTTHIAVLNDAWSNSKYLEDFSYKHLIIDEADQIYSMAKLRFNREITEADQRFVMDEVLDLWSDANLEKLEEACVEKLKNKRCAVNKPRVLDIYASVRVIRWHRPKAIYANYFKYGKDSSSGAFVMNFRNPSRIVARLFEEKQCIFMSGTLWMGDNMDSFKRLIGAEDISTHSGELSYEYFGKMRFVLAPRITASEKASFEANHRADPNHPSFTDFALTEAVLKETTGHRLVLLPSTADTLKLANLVPHAHHQRSMENGKHVVRRFLDDKSPNKILIAHGLWAGLDLGNTKFSHIIIPRLPYIAPSDLDFERFKDNVEWTARKVNQGLGRGIRAIDDECTAWILDRRFPWSGRMISNQPMAPAGDNSFSASHTHLKFAIPKRFVETVKENDWGYNRGSVCEIKDDDSLKIWWFKNKPFAL